MEIIRSKNFKSEKAWGAKDIATMNGVTSRLHWTDEPYIWHINDGEEIFAVMDGRVEMKYRENGKEDSVILNAGDIFYASVGTEHVAHPIGEARILVIEKEGSIQMELNANFEKIAVVRPEDYKWVPSPMKGVERMMLDRIGDEVARATTIVKFAPNSEFSPHDHCGGEEFLVLEGVFSDEHADYPAGSYVRNPIGTFHTPKIGEEGATIFVKLYQFEEEDQKQFSINTNEAEWYPGLVPGLSVMPLHEYGTEHAALVKWAPNTIFKPHQHWGGEEIFVLEGTFYDEHGEYPKGTWIRSPHLSRHHPYTKEDGALIYVKTGHLPIKE